VLMNFGLLAGLWMKGAAPVGAKKPIDEFPDFTERWSFGDGELVVVRIPLEGLITRERGGGLFFPGVDRVQLVLHQIRAAENDERVRAILLEVNSPGGGVTASDEIHNALSRFRASAPDRRILVFARDVAASGAYYAAMAGDWMIAEPTSIIGSIGVMIQTVNWRELSERIGVRDTTIRSGEAKDILNPFRDVSEQETRILQHLVDSMHQRFLRVVREGRALEEDALSRIADGRVMTAEDALTAGLIDEVGYWDDAVDRMAELLGVPAVRIIRYERRPDFSAWLMGARNPLHLETVLELDRPRLLYLWRP